MTEESITITGMDPVLRAALKAEAARLGISLNDLILSTLSDSLNLAGSTQLFRDLERLADSLSREDMQELDAATKVLEQFGALPEEW